MHATCCAPECGSDEDVAEFRGNELVGPFLLAAVRAVEELVGELVENLPGVA